MFYGDSQGYLQNINEEKYLKTQDVPDLYVIFNHGDLEKNFMYFFPWCPTEGAGGD